MRSAYHGPPRPRRGLRLLCVVTLGLALAFGLTTCEPAPTLTPTPAATPTATLTPGPSLGVLFYPVYGYERETGERRGGLGTSGWNDDPPIRVKPSQGYYCFGHREYQEWLIRQLEEHGFDWILISWNGWGDVDLDGVIEAEDFEAANEDIKGFLSLLDSQDSELKAALLVEPFIVEAELYSQHRQVILDKLCEIYSLHPQVMFQWEGKPLLVEWHPVELGEDQRFTIRKLGSFLEPEAKARCGLDWNWYPSLDNLEANISDDGFVCVFPRFDETLLAEHGLIPWEPRVIDQFLKEGVYEQEWGVLKQNKERIRTILVYAWNAYGEQAFIEPAVGREGEDPRYGAEGLLQLTEELYTEFRGPRLATLWYTFGFDLTLGVSLMELLFEPA